MTPNHLASLDAAAELGKKATKRPWTAYLGNTTTDGRPNPPCEAVTAHRNRVRVCSNCTATDARFIDASGNLDHAAIAAELRAKDAALAHAHSVLNLVLHRIDWSKVNPLQVDEATVREAVDVVRSALTPAAGDDHDG